jgi:quercetin dioxygenase-like cupin family protein
MTETGYQFIQNILDEIPSLPEKSIISRTFFQDEHLKAILFGFAAGQELSEHTASVPAMIQILEGEATLGLGTDRYEVGAGAWAHLPPGLPHSVYAHTAVKMLLTMLVK